MTPLTFDELVARGVVPDRATLDELITRKGFPQRVSHQDEIWRQDHVDNWLRQHGRPTTRDGERKATAEREHQNELADLRSKVAELRE
jgi:Zn-finger nucleic acid-binding protein